MEIQYIKYKEIAPELVGWDFISLWDVNRIYYKARENKNGFDFKQINLVSYLMDEEWSDSEADCELLLHGVALFDGIRHLYFGDEKSDNFGYFYYPNLADLKRSLDILKELEDRYCQENR